MGGESRVQMSLAARRGESVLIFSCTSCSVRAHTESLIASSLIFPRDVLSAETTSGDGGIEAFVRQIEQHAQQLYPLLQQLGATVAAAIAINKAGAVVTDTSETASETVTEPITDESAAPVAPAPQGDTDGTDAGPTAGP